MQKTITTILLVVCILLGWGLTITDKSPEQSDEYIQAMNDANKYYEKGLYQKAIAKYEEAIEVADTIKATDGMVDAAEMLFQENEDTYDTYVAVLQKAVEAHGKEEKYSVDLAKLYVVLEKHNEACKTLENYSGKKSKEFNELYASIRYSYSLSWKSFEDYHEASYGYFGVKQVDKEWALITTDGVEELGGLLFAGPINEDYIGFISDPNRNIIYDIDDEMVEGRIKFVPTFAGIMMDGLMPISNGKEFYYYNADGNRKIGPFSNASNFYEEVAAVSNKDWYLISTDGEPVSEEHYEEIVVDSNGTYMIDGVMLAKKDGNYHLYDDFEEQISEFLAREVDIVTEDGLIAFSNGEKWGFVNTEGKVIIEPQYASAKSFSNGLAAVYNGKFWGFITEDGTVVIDYQFVDAGYFSEEGSCMVKQTDTHWQLLELYIN